MKREIKKTYSQQNQKPINKKFPNNNPKAKAGQSSSQNANGKEKVPSNKELKLKFFYSPVVKDLSEHFSQTKSVDSAGPSRKTSTPPSRGSSPRSVKREAVVLVRDRLSHKNFPNISRNSSYSSHDSDVEGFKKAINSYIPKPEGWKRSFAKRQWGRVGDDSLREQDLLPSPPRSNTSNDRSVSSSKGLELQFGSFPEVAGKNGLNSSRRSLIDAERRNLHDAKQTASPDREKAAGGSLSSSESQSSSSYISEDSVVEDYFYNQRRRRVCLMKDEHIVLNREHGELIVELSELSLAREIQLVNHLDSEGKWASKYIAEFVRDRLRKDRLKALRGNVLIGNRALAHFFSPAGVYLGKVALQEKVWFYFRTAGRSHGEYISCGDGKVSRLFIKTRFPTLQEVVAHDWAKGYSSLEHMTLYDPVFNRNVHAKKGYCWLPLFLKSKIPLSKYPQCPYVRLNHLRRLFGEVKLVKAGEYYHYSESGVKNSKLPNVLVGATPEGLNTEIVSMSAVNGNPLLSVALDSVVKKLTMRESSHFQNAVDDILEVALKSDLRERVDKRFKVDCSMTAEQLDLLRKMLKINNIEAGYGSPGAHPIFNAMRKFFNEMCARAYRGVLVSDIGGSILNCVVNKLTNTHVCAPNLDLKDAGRLSKACISLLNKVGDFKEFDENYLKFMTTISNLSVCNASVPNCKHRSSVITMVDVYDIHVEQLLQAMEVKGAVLARLFFMFPPEILAGAESVQYPETSLTVSKEGRDLVYFIGETGDSYVHSLDTLLSYITRSVVVSKTGNSYYIELNEQFGPYLDITVSLTRRREVQTLPRRLVPWTAGMTRITIPRMNEHGVVDKFSILVNRDFVRRSLSYAANVCNTTDDRTFEYVMSNLRSQTTMMVVGSKIVHTKVDLSNDVIVELPTVILNEAVSRRNRAVKMLKQANRGFLYKIFSTLYKGLTASVCWVLKKIFNCLPKCVVDACEDLFKTHYGLKDTDDEIVVNFSVESGPLDCENEYIEELLTISQALAGLNCKAGPMRLEEEINEIEEELEDDSFENLKNPINESKNERSGGLKGGGATNWYDFLLPNRPEAKPADSARAALWRLCRRLTRMVCNLDIVTPIRRLLTTLLLALSKFINPDGRYENVKRKDEERLDQTLKTMVGEILKRGLVKVGDLLKGLSHVACKPLVYVGQASTTLFTNACSALKEDAADRIRQLKHRIAKALKAADMAYPKNWIIEGKYLRFFNKYIRRFIPHAAFASVVVSAIVISKANKVFCKTLNTMFDKLKSKLENLKLVSTSTLCAIMLGMCFCKFVNLISVVSAVANPLTLALPVYVGAEFSSVVHDGLSGRNIFNFNRFMRILINLSALKTLKPPIEYVPTSDSDRSGRDATDVVPDLNRFDRRMVMARALDTFRTAAVNLQRDETRLEKASQTQNLHENPHQANLIDLTKAQDSDSERLRKGKAVVSDVHDVVANESLEVMRESGEIMPGVGQEIGSSSGASRCRFEGVFKPAIPVVFGEKDKRPFEESSRDSDSTITPERNLVVEHTQTLTLGDDVRSEGESVENNQTVNTEVNVSRCVNKVSSPLKIVDRPEQGVVQQVCKVQPVNRFQVVKTILANTLGFSFTGMNSFLDIESYRTLVRRVSGSDGYSAVLEALCHSLHGLRAEVDVLDKVVKQEIPLIGHKHELFCKNIQELDRVKYKPDGFHYYNVELSNIYGLVNTRKLVYNNDPVVKESEGIVLLEPHEISFNLIRSLALIDLLVKVSVEEVNKAIDNVKFVNAVPGAGKTYQIKQRMLRWVDSEKDGSALLVLTSSRNSADTLKAFAQEKRLGKMVQILTVDAFLFQARGRNVRLYKTLLIDECYMTHAGILRGIIAAVKPEECVLYGDRRQVPFINRIKLLNDNKSFLKPSFGNYSEMLITRRCPADICWWMSNVNNGKKGDRLYSGPVKLFTQSKPVLKSVTCKAFSKGDHSLFSQVDRVMTFTQNEKNELISEYMSRGIGTIQDAKTLIGTVAESQGETYKRVHLVAFKPTDDQVFSSMPHRLVALSRHTISLQYFCIPNKMNKGIGEDVQSIIKLEERVAANFVVQQCV
uniref:Polyprotein n=2 Tax=Pineapple mealybug wilt-associated virus 1 TaxID=180903 RepID=A0A4D6G317_9CLOS|nr:polyprotein [Pineapple mealybug wilt-associated virus 1]QJQ80376.1 polyprotein [Pineapple mealybug wilt-associated virus 1]